MGKFNSEHWLFNTSSKTRWFWIVGFFGIVAAFDFTTPPEYILAYLYIIPILISISFLKPELAKRLVILAVFATLLNLIFPHNVLGLPWVVISRLLAALAITVSSFFMVRYIRYQQQIREQEQQLNLQFNLAQVREDFIATLTHDLKTPLLGEEQTLKYLLQEIAGPLTDEQRQMLEVLQRGNQRQLDLVQTLVTAYRNDNLGVELQSTTVNLDELIADVLIEVQVLAQARNIALNYSCGEAPPLVSADPLQIKRVLANLLHNALNYTPGGGKIQITLSRRDKEALIEVADTGPGVPKNDLDRIFNRFYQAGESRQVVGTGLGLYLSRQIIMAHRGSIWIKNVKPSGCKFSFTLPVDNNRINQGLDNG